MRTGRWLPPLRNFWLPNILYYTYKSGGGIGVWTSLAKVLPPLPRRPAHTYDNAYQFLPMYNNKYNSFYIFQDNWFQIQILMNIIKI